MSNNILIIGCGDIGRRVAKRYRNENVTGIVCSAESASNCKSLGINAFQTDFDKQIILPEDLAAKIYYFMPPPPRGIEDTRIQGFLNTINDDVINDNTKKRIVLISTTGVYGDSKGAWIDESIPVNPKADRAHRRLSAESALISWAKQTGGEYMILRVPGIYAQDRLPLTRLKKALPIVKEEEAGWTNRIHADDLAQACKAAMESSYSNEIINICDGNPSTMTGYFNQVADYANLPRPAQISMKQAEKTLSEGMVSYLKESRRISNAKMKKLLAIKLKYPTLQSCLKIEK